jgi:hypothetical protein
MPFGQKLFIQWKFSHLALETLSKGSSTLAKFLPKRALELLATETN